MTASRPSVPIARRDARALPVVDTFGSPLDGEVARGTLAGADAGCAWRGQAIGVVVRNLALSHQPLYSMNDWRPVMIRRSRARADEVSSSTTTASGGPWSASSRRIARAFSAVSCSTPWPASASTAPNCTTTRRRSPPWAYTQATGATRGGRTTVAARGGTPRTTARSAAAGVDLTVAADGAVPIAHRLESGNTEDSTTHIATWDSLCALLVVTTSCTCGLQARHQGEHGAHRQRRRRFVSVLPATRKEDGHSGATWWTMSRVTEALRRPARHIGEPDDVFSTTEAPWPSAEGFRSSGCVRRTSRP